MWLQEKKGWRVCKEALGGDRYLYYLNCRDGNKVLYVSPQITNIIHRLWSSFLYTNYISLNLSVEKAMGPHSSTLAWKIPWMEEPGRLQSMGSLRDTTERLHFHFSLSCIGEGNGNPLQCSCLENPRDRGDTWAAVYGVTQRRTRLKWLSSSSKPECVCWGRVGVGNKVLFSQKFLNCYRSEISLLSPRSLLWSPMVD